ncbi:SRPBCC domain-containing protein [Leptospira fluminis]|uniref:SRPBCC domain-containing protein n=1 Tax=Leptospira fluminis TaxID=2484979 RepID=A0A4R9GSN6_9LEPT|nr:SRPBCC domain-containing protein [Leptospira fluminis]TGK20156.1 SRPBCC domain-containing protein [Leptospira fluminis]
MDTRSIVKEFRYDFPLEKVWSAVTVNEELIHWLADKVTGRPKIGAKFSWTWNLGPEGELTSNGIYKKIIPFEELILEWEDHPAGSIELKLEFEKDGDGATILRLTNSGYPSGEKFDHWIEAASEGWDEESMNLLEYLRRN